MRRERTRRRGADPCKSHRLFLLLFFLFGALLLRFWPPMRDMTGGAEKLLPCVLLLPALLGGSPCGLWLIPAAALWLGASAMLQLLAAGRFSDHAAAVGGRAFFRACSGDRTAACRDAAVLPDGGLRHAPVGGMSVRSHPRRARAAKNADPRTERVVGHRVRRRGFYILPAFPVKR